MRTIKDMPEHSRPREKLREINTDNKCPRNAPLAHGAVQKAHDPDNPLGMCR